MGKSKVPCVYILASSRNGTIYVGVTSDLPDRMEQHRQGLTPGFTSKHGVKALVCYELDETMEMAIAREKRLKKWNRLWKLKLIERMNPEWHDLHDGSSGEILDGPADAARRKQRTGEAPLDARVRGRDGALGTIEGLLGAIQTTLARFDVGSDPGVSRSICWMVREFLARR